jgi:cysteine-rich repeat protein
MATFNGFHDKCLIAHSNLLFDHNFIFYFVINISNYIFQQTDPNHKVKMFCLMMDFDCSDFDPNCIKCQSYSICTQCTPTHYLTVYSNRTSLCKLCSLAITNCVNCNDSNICTLCLPGSFVFNNVCVCNAGRFQNGLCTTDFGCVSTYMNNGFVSCLFCNSATDYQIVPVDGVCRCLPQYALNQQSICADLCGDGVVMINQHLYCDDGNLVSGDGCSSSCSV